MKCRPGLLALMFMLTWIAASRADPLPVVGPIGVDKLRAHVRQVLEALDKLKAPLPAASEKELKALMEGNVEDAVEFSRRVQDLLDAQCLVGVNINPESRVKVARGPAEARLTKGRETVLLIKVHNEAGVTAPLAVSGPDVDLNEREKREEWLEVVATSVAAKTLNGGELEYVLLRLKPSEAGKREATLRCDVGQGTQDLGFRAEVPILFTISPN